MDKKEIVKILEEIGRLLEIKGENPFKARAYYNAARRIEVLQEDLTRLVEEGRLKELKGVGDALAQKIETLVKTGRLPYYEELKASVPQGLLEMLKIPGMGPKKVKTVYEKLEITTIGELEYACHENRLRDLPGFGLKTQQKILKGIELRKKYTERFHLPVALEEAAKIKRYMEAHPAAQKIEIAGSLRRRKETIKDIDLLIACRQQDREALVKHFVSYSEVDAITNQGHTKASVVLKSGLACDLRLVEEGQFPFALQYFTGSAAHNTALRHRARVQKLTLNEYGLFPENAEQSIPCASESDVYRHLGLAFIPPELREDFGEIEAAEKGALPQLIEKKDLKGLFHVHTTYSDGASSIEEMARRAMELGFDYIGICDHSKAAYYANGLSEERIKMQHQEIERLNEMLDPFVILKGIEVDILPDGTLDYSDDVLETFDFVIASVHSSFNLEEEAMTERICRALRHPLVNMLGHPTGRLLLGREPYAVNMDKVLEVAARFNKVIEINANPYRLDLDWRQGIKAAKMGIKVAVNPDAHSLDGLNDFEYGLAIARKSWFTASEVLNSYSVEKLKSFFKAQQNAM
ncbi:PHP domain protein [Caldithrix abyssi DSM 13497]|uniref:DNA polymerase beta n=1 Tax=Caldithrix abyssi DSM 13497 TaxID=880073 RepID=H1XUA0_CALAY|nr:DNA polymerase (family 10) [Caldithrix abyssi DSM 13497]EHO41590.1 PHP domain protein [Caldithrix abyssi DSM 13497]